MLAPVTHFLPLTTIVRKRLLPVKGKVVARLNQRVIATEVVAEAHYAREYVLLDVARTFGISPLAADRLIRCKAGEELTEGTLIAEKKGLFSKTMRAPSDGRVIIAGNGQVLMEVGETSLELRAGMPGIVTEVIPDWGVVIQTTGVLIQGVWGNGRMDTGLMLPLLEKPADVLTAAQLDVSLRGSVLLAGHCRDGEVLRAAAELPVRGLILSSLMPSLLPLAAQMRYPILVIDGFGNLPMNPSAFKILSTNVKREVTIRAETYDRYTGTRPELVIPLPVNQEVPVAPDLATFAPEQQVRLRRAPHVGEIATLTRLLPGSTVLPVGLRVPAAEVRLQNGEQIIVPLVNLEVIA
jgi:hypothetical protein